MPAQAEQPPRAASALAVSHIPNRVSASHQSTGSVAGMRSNVLGAPTRVYSRKPSSWCVLAFSATIRLATLPTRVRLPATVLTQDSTSQAKLEYLPKTWISGLTRSTRGTLLITFEPIRTNRAKIAKTPELPKLASSLSGPSITSLQSRLGNPVSLMPLMTMNRELKNNKRLPSTERNISSGGCRSKMTIAEAPQMHVHPSGKSAINPIMTPSATVKNATSLGLVMRHHRNCRAFGRGSAVPSAIQSVDEVPNVELSGAMGSVGSTCASSASPWVPSCVESARWAFAMSSACIVSSVGGNNCLRNKRQTTLMLMSHASAATGPRGTRKSKNENPDLVAIIMFCGLPIGVTAAPMLADVANAIKYGAGGNFRAATTLTTSGVRKRHAGSFMNKAADIKLTAEMHMRSENGDPHCFNIGPAKNSKKPSRSR
mmetsp:Transcript_17978/g.44741  ORF Transcript_17978/g.44741 Transcript_17978/m.44741 type:complete len:429 (+) Transcript_17978:44-1330(+)